MSLTDTVDEYQRLKKELGEEGAKEALRRRADEKRNKKGLKYMRHVDPGGAIGDATRRYGQAGGYAWGQYKRAGQEAREAEEMLRRRAMGEESLSAEQLRQGLQTNVAAQRSLASGAGPRDRASALRNAMIQSSRMGSGLAGQQALAGIAERQAAQDALTRAILARRDQDIKSGLGYSSLESGGLGLLSNERLGHRGLGKGGGPSTGQRLIGAGAGLGGAIIGGYFGGPGGAAAGYAGGKKVGDAVGGSGDGWV